MFIKGRVLGGMSITGKIIFYLGVLLSLIGLVYILGYSTSVYCLIYRFGIGIILFGLGVVLDGRKKEKQE